MQQSIWIRTLAYAEKYLIPPFDCINRDLPEIHSQEFKNCCPTCQGFTDTLHHLKSLRSGQDLSSGLVPLLVNCHFNIRKQLSGVLNLIYNDIWSQRINKQAWIPNSQGTLYRVIQRHIAVFRKEMAAQG